MDPENLARAIGVPLDQWPGNCHGIACAVRDLLPVHGMRLARGHWTGDVAWDSVYRNSSPIQHSWLVAPDGRMLDPTRWALLSPSRPFIYLGVNDCYDEGGRELAARLSPRFPGTDPYAGIVEGMDLGLRHDLEKTFGMEGADAPRLARALEHAIKDDPSRIPEAAAVYSVLERAGRKGIIPIDSWTWVMEPEELFCKTGQGRTFVLPPAPEMNDVEIVSEIFRFFLSPEERPDIERELEDLGYDLDRDLWSCLNRLDSLKSWAPMDLLPRDLCDTLSVIADDLLGKGFGQELRVERFAASLGVDQARLDRILSGFGARAGYNLGWHVPRPKRGEQEEAAAVKL